MWMWLYKVFLPNDAPEIPGLTMPRQPGKKTVIVMLNGGGGGISREEYVAARRANRAGVRIVGLGALLGGLGGAGLGALAAKGLDRLPGAFAGLMAGGSLGIIGGGIAGTVRANNMMDDYYESTLRKRNT